jgi:hypothetical protein
VQKLYLECRVAREDAEGKWLKRTNKIRLYVLQVSGPTLMIWTRCEPGNLRANLLCQEGNKFFGFIVYLRHESR